MRKLKKHLEKLHEHHAYEPLLKKGWLDWCEWGAVEITVVNSELAGNYITWCIHLEWEFKLTHMQVFTMEGAAVHI